MLAENQVVFAASPSIWRFCCFSRLEFSEKDGSKKETGLIHKPVLQKAFRCCEKKLDASDDHGTISVKKEKRFIIPELFLRSILSKYPKGRRRPCAM